MDGTNPGIPLPGSDQTDWELKQELNKAKENIKGLEEENCNLMRSLRTIKDLQAQTNVRLVQQECEIKRMMKIQKESIEELKMFLADQEAKHGQ